ncbi:hypothetical protein Tco_0963606, partial [Tanacetum coccineum]
MLEPGIDNDIYSIVDACPNACEIWKAIERLKQGESINVQDLETNLYWEFGKFTSRDGESLESYYSRFMTLVKLSQELKIVSYHKLYDILKQHQTEVNEISAERLACSANPLALVSQQQPAYHPQNHPNHHTQNSSTRSQQATRNRGKAIVNSFAPIYDQEPATVAEDDEMSKEKEIDKLMALISLSGTGYENQRVVNVVGARESECQKPKRAKDAAYHKEKMLLCKQEEARVQMNEEQADWKDETDDESDDQELEAHYMYMAQIQEVTPDIADISGPIFDAEPLQKVQNNDDTYNVDRDDQDDTDDLLTENALVDKLKGEIEDFKTKNKSLESSNNHFKEANNDLSKTNKLMFINLKKFQAELDRYHDVNYASKVAIDCVKAKGDLMSYKIESEKSFNEYTRKINDLNQTISDMIKELFAHQETISTMSQEKEAQIKFYKTREDIELDKVIALENKVKVLDDIVYKIGQSVQTMNLLNRNCKTSFAKPEFLKKAQRANPLLYDIGLIPTTRVSRPQLKSNQMGDRVMPNNSQGKKREVEDQRKNFKFSNDKTFVTACNDSLNAKTSNVNFVCVTCGKCVLNDNHDLCVLHYINGVNSRSRQPIVVPISTREPKQTVNHTVATSHKKTVTTNSTIKKPRNVIRKIYEQIQRISLTGFPAQSVGSSNTDVLDSPCLLVLITGTSQSRQH